MKIGSGIDIKNFYISSLLTVVGQNRNTASGIRRQMLGGNLVRNERHGLLNGIDPTPIIVVQKTGKFVKLTFKILMVKTNLSR